MRATRNGFTLMELGVVLAVLALGMAYIAPDFVEKSRAELAVKTAKEMAAIMDASKWYYMNQGGDPADRALMVWPGEAAGQLCAANITGAQTDLINGGYLRSQDFMNPWNQQYSVRLQPSADNVGWGGVIPANPASHNCRLVVSTDVPASVAPAIMTFMPMATCESQGGTCPGGAPAGFDRCCTKLVRPGQEGILQQWINPSDVDGMCDKMMGGEQDTGPGGTGKCDVRQKFDIHSCYYTPDADSGACNEGYVAVGNKQINCGKYCQRTVLKCCKGAL